MPSVCLDHKKHKQKIHYDPITYYFCIKSMSKKSTSQRSFSTRYMSVNERITLLSNNALTNDVYASLQMIKAVWLIPKIYT